MDQPTHWEGNPVEAMPMGRSTTGQDLAVIVWIYTGLTMRCAHAEVDGAHVDGVDAAGANGKGVNVDGARGVGTRGVGARGANVDWGVNAGVCGGWCNPWSECGA